MRPIGQETHPVLLLSHDPESRWRLRRFDWDLMLSGHTHGGQAGNPFTGDFISFRSSTPAGLYEFEGNRRVAALYDLIPSNADKYLNDMDEWNTGKIVSKGNKVEHWLNGKKVVEYVRGSKEFRAAVAESKYAKNGTDGQPWGELPEGRILLQDHSDSTVSFRNLKIREL